MRDVSKGLSGGRLRVCSVPRSGVRMTSLRSEVELALGVTRAAIRCPWGDQAGPVQLPLESALKVVGATSIERVDTKSKIAPENDSFRLRAMYSPSADQADTYQFGPASLPPSSRRSVRRFERLSASRITR